MTQPMTPAALPVQAAKTANGARLVAAKATTPFVDYDFSIEIATPIVAKARNINFFAAPIAQHAIVSDSRGPPAIIC